MLATHELRSRSETLGHSTGGRSDQRKSLRLSGRFVYQVLHAPCLCRRATSPMICSDYFCWEAKSLPFGLFGRRQKRPSEAGSEYLSGSLRKRYLHAHIVV